MTEKLSCSLFFLSLLVHASSKSIPASRTGKSCGGNNFCENPKDYPSELILQLLKNQTITPGLFDAVPSNKRSVDLLKLVTKDIINILAKEDSAGEISNFIDDEKAATSNSTEAETEFNNAVREAKHNETIFKIGI